MFVLHCVCPFFLAVLVAFYLGKSDWAPIPAEGTLKGPRMVSVQQLERSHNHDVITVRDRQGSLRLSLPQDIPAFDILELKGTGNIKVWWATEPHVVTTFVPVNGTAWQLEAGDLVQWHVAEVATNRERRYLTFFSAMIALVLYSLGAGVWFGKRALVGSP